MVFETQLPYSVKLFLEHAFDFLQGRREHFQTSALLEVLYFVGLLA